MKVFGKVALAAVGLSLVGAPASAQMWKWDWGINGGYSWLTKSLGRDETGLGPDVGSNSMLFSKGFLGGTQLTFFPSAKFGLRLNARYGSRDFKGSDMEDATSVDFVENVHLWGGTLDALIRLKAPAEEYTKMEVLPYLALGAGLKWHNPAADTWTCADAAEGKSWSCGPFVTGAPGSPRYWALGEQKVFLGHAGIGADWRVSRNFAIRTEFSDQIFQPQIYVTEATPTANVYDLPQGDENQSNWTHELAGQIGLHFLFGVPRPVAVAVIPAPTPAPVQPEPVRPTTPTPTPPREDMITVCVIDPTAPGGYRMQDAIYRVEQRDTMVNVNGQRIAIRNAVGNVVVANNADWFVRGNNLVMNVGNEKVEFAVTGSPTMVSGSDLAFLGTINGLPIYADRDDVADVRDELADLNRAQRGTDLGKILGEHKDLRDELEDVKLFYVPFQPTGCVFQTLQLQPPVRKGKE